MHTQGIIGFGASNEEAARKLSDEAHRRRKRMLNSLGPESVKTARERKRSTRKILIDRLCIFATLVDVARKRYGYETPILPLLSLSTQISMWAKCNEPVWLEKKESYSTKERWYCKLGLVEATRNALLHQVIKQTFEPLHTQFMSKGGLPQFEIWLAEYLPKAKFVFTTDIPSYFDLVRRSSVLSGLPHLRRVIERVLFDVKDRGKPIISGLNDNLSQVCLTNTTTFAEASSPGRGIPLGAAGSSIVSELVIKMILQAIAKSCPGVHCAAHGDNLIFLIEEQQSIPSLRLALDKQIGKHVGFDVIGELAHRNTIVPSNQWFFFCGCWYQWEENQLKKKSDELRLENYANKIVVLSGDAKTPDDFLALEKSVKGWMIAHKFSPQALELGGEIMGHIGAMKYYMAGPPEQTS